MPGFPGALAEARGGLCSGVRLSRQGGHAGSAGDLTVGSWGSAWGGGFGRVELGGVSAAGCWPDQAPALGLPRRLKSGLRFGVGSQPLQAAPFAGHMLQDTAITSLLRSSLPLQGLLAKAP